MVMLVFGGAHLKNRKINSTQSVLNFGFVKRVPNKDWVRLVENSISPPHKKIKISRDFLKSSLTMISLSNHYWLSWAFSDWLREFRHATRQFFGCLGFTTGPVLVHTLSKGPRYPWWKRHLREGNKTPSQELRNAQSKAASQTKSILGCPVGS